MEEAIDILTNEGWTTEQAEEIALAMEITNDN